MLRYFSAEKRRRLAPVVLVVGACLLGKLAHDDFPRDEELKFELPGPTVAAMRVTYRSDGDVYGGFEQHFPENAAPRSVRHTASLAPGHYELGIDLTDVEGKTTHVERAVEVPSDGLVTIPLGGPR